MEPDKLKKWIAENNQTAIENAWMEAMIAERPPEQMRTALDTLNALQQQSIAESLGGMYVGEALEQGPSEKALKLCREVLPALQGNPELRKSVVELYRSQYGEHEHFEVLLRCSGLADSQSLRRAVRTLEICLSLRPGTYLANRFEHDVLRMEEFDETMEEYRLVRADGMSEQVEPKRLADEYEPVEENDFRVLTTFRTDALGEMLTGDVESLLVGICQARGGRVEMPELKEMLLGEHLESSKWSSWWSRARTAAKKSDNLTIEGRNPAVIEYHPGGRTLEEELAENARRARTPLQVLDVLRVYAREARNRGQECDAEFAAELMGRLAHQAGQYRQNRPADALTAALAIEEARALGLPAPQKAPPAPAEILAEAQRPEELIRRQHDEDLLAAALGALADREDAGDVYLRLLTSLPAGVLGSVAERIHQAGRDEQLREAVQDALIRSTENIQMMLWLWSETPEALAEPPSALDLLGRILNAVQEIAREEDIPAARRRELFQQIRNTLTAQDGQRFREALAEIDENVARTLKRRLDRCEALSDAAAETLQTILREVFPRIFLAPKVVAWEDESVMYTTAASLRRQQEELKDLLEVRMPENSKAIGEAASLGDLSENSEWQFAIEERRRMQAQVSQLQNDLARARVIEAEDVPEDSVGIGTRVTLRSPEDGRQVDLSFLGPWDADVQQRVYSYLTPLAQSLMGQPLGETVTVKLDNVEGEWTIEAVAPAQQLEG
jgi:transcription elongation GreA/GreB family factor